MNHSTDKYEAACRDMENILEVFEEATVTIKVTDYNNLLDKRLELEQEVDYLIDQLVQLTDIGIAIGIVKTHGYGVAQRVR